MTTCCKLAFSLCDFAGCKIKALRAKTNTYIRTPVRGEAPVFVVTGRKEDVALAKKEILSAAEHFSQIRASRRNNSNGGLHGPPSPGTPGQVTIQVRVPYRVVGLVVGPKGATIKRIQQQAQTYIVTPSRDKEPIFEVTGLPENVEKARREIESHIALRTGGSLSDGPLVGNVRPMHVGGNQIPDDRLNDFQTNGIDAGSHDLHDLMNSMYKPPSSNSAFTSYRSNTYPQDSNVFAYPSKLPESHGFGSNGSFGLYDSDEGIGSSPSFDSNPIGTLSGNSIWSDFMDMPVSSIMNPLAEGLTSNAQCLSPTGSTNFEGVDNSTRRFTNGELTNIGLSGMSAFTPFHQNDSRLRGTSATFGVSGSTSTSPTDSTGSLGNQRQNCFGSLDNEVSPW